MKYTLWYVLFLPSILLPMDNPTTALKNKIEQLIKTNHDLSHLKETSPLLDHNLYGKESLSYLIPELLQKKADPNAYSSDRECPLYFAIFVNDTQAAKHLLQAGAQPNDSNITAWPHLIHAIRNGNVDMVRTLLQYGADPNVSFQNQSALEFTLTKKLCTHSDGHVRIADLEQNRTSIVKLLLAYNVQIDATNAKKRTPFQASKEYYLSQIKPDALYPNELKKEYSKASRAVYRFMEIKKYLSKKITAEIANVIVCYENS